ncbi:SAM-dependent methyltransferase [Paramecium bursaria Chlorella virus NY2B]|uniref:SAM-dependent methyltransferase n=1 Tax=Paramecium bursaria Chlorella virus NYs1 TaxID=83442 RepID=M1I804_9PHYC|nr:SAM-dependent methyltransferase [Paramecium bursaria Chlorella virus NYs1]AGE54090.1 SAM-dependent methyltransferase [Paramecium bursaria Chlorella virus IL-5-2s1]AGE58258.1 SAM-dependent methyltransferase [Paramecium bursaria Chlorella virus NY2B]AGE58629.1 SAM-dependent methyltransferase [Paramecium bursaria Chlorella virus NYs1]
MSMFDRIEDLKNKGYNPDTILDIGANHGAWTRRVKHIYPSSIYHLFEAIDYDELRDFAFFSKTDVHNVILNEKKDEVDWFEMRNTGDSMFKEKSNHFEDCKPIRRETIDLNSYVKENDISLGSNILIKIDCQGAEISILKGSSEILRKTDFIIMEIPFFGQYNEGVGSFLDHIKFMDDIGFIPYDIMETHTIVGFKLQIDVMFINKTHEFNEKVQQLLMKNDTT